MKKIDRYLAKKRHAAMTLIEVILATFILFMGVFFIFEIISTSYSHITKMKFRNQVALLLRAKVEDILFNNDATECGWTAYPGYPDFQYRIEMAKITPQHLFPEYELKKVMVFVKGPINKNNVPEYTLHLTITLMDETQNVTTFREDAWGEGLSEGLEIP